MPLLYVGMSKLTFLVRWCLPGSPFCLEFGVMMLSNPLIPVQSIDSWSFWKTLQTLLLLHQTS